MDIIPLLSRASVFAVVLCRLVWLKCWSADQASKKALVDLPFKGDRLFGASLDDIIKDATGGKSTMLPQSGKGKEPCRKRGPSFTAPKRFFRAPTTTGKGPQGAKAPAAGQKRTWFNKPHKPADKSASA